jgi:hypothetical protein
MLTVLTIIVTAAIAALTVYLKWTWPTQRKLAQAGRQLSELEMQLAEECRVRADLVKWIEIECFKFKFIEKALKQRIDERLEVLRQL